MNVPAIARILIFMVVAGLLTSCGLVAGQPTVSPAATASPPPPPPSISASPSAPLSPSPSSPPIIEPTTEPTQRTPSPTNLLPPRGFLTGEDDPVEGWLGSYCWNNICADLPAPPAINQLPVLDTAASQLTFSLGDGTAFAQWQASYYAADPADAHELGGGGENFDPDAVGTSDPALLTDATFAAPPSGSSIVQVQIFVPGGDATYFWHVAVE